MQYPVKEIFGLQFFHLDNNRGITLTSNVNKVFFKSLETLILDFFESNTILGETQYTIFPQQCEQAISPVSIKGL
jgi:hypothetical protein